MPLMRFFPFLVLAVLVGGVGAGCEPSEQQGERGSGIAPRPVKTVVVNLEPTAMRRVYPAVVLPVREVELSFPFSGQIVELPVRGASRVEEGDVIAQLDTRTLEAELAQLESQLAQSRAQLRLLTEGARVEDVAVLEAEVAAARAEAEAAAVQLERSRELFRNGVIAQEKLDSDSTQLMVAEAVLEALRRRQVFHM